MHPAPGLNVIRGDNAQGKTSVLEALLYVATSKSHRTNVDEDLRQSGSEGFYISCRVERSGREWSLESTWKNGEKRFRVNGVAQERISDILGKVVAVMFSPEDIALVKGGASGRRRFLDMELSQVQPRYLSALQQYRQSLRQRNQLLKNERVDGELLGVWDEQLATHGTVVQAERAKFVDELGKLATAAYRRIAEVEELTLAYVPDIKAGDSLREVLRRGRESDIRRGQTLRGPHRDDFEFLIDGRAARTYASQGQQKSVALSLKLAEMDLVLHRTNEYPVLMLDDVFSELDRNRSARVVESLDRRVQCLVTTTEMGRRPELFGECTYFQIEGGILHAG
jgi:DNA replication and repair protein RecF